LAASAGAITLPVATPGPFYRDDVTDVANSISTVTEIGCAQGASSGDVALCVDLDGTLIRGDLLWESVMLMLRRQPQNAWKLPLWVARGKAGFKDALAQHVAPDTALLAYRADVLEFIRGERAAGRRVILATASHEKLAEKVAAHLGVFDDVLASRANVNLSGARKLAAIREHLHGEAFDYIGDSAADVPLCRAARLAYLVSPKGSVIVAVGPAYDPARRFGDKGGTLKAWIKAIRPVQWSKNLLIFVPLMTAHKITDLVLVSQVLLAFVAFSLCASAVYLLNDLLDIESDRQHPKKRNRPLASGKLSIPMAVATCGLLVAASFALSAALLPVAFVETLAVYLAMTTLYSVWVKTKLLMDVIVLAGLYTLRIVAGGTATGVEISEYLLAFSMFMFTSLAVMKRYTELLIMQDRDQRESKGRGYITADLTIMDAMGPALGCMSVLVMALYIQYMIHPPTGDTMVHPTYHHPKVLWGVCPVLLYWIMRAWVLAKRRHFADDPIAFALRDRTSWIAGILAVAAVVLASL